MSDDKITFEQFQEMMRRASTNENTVVGIAAVVVFDDNSTEMTLDTFPENIEKLEIAWIQLAQQLSTHREQVPAPEPVLKLVPIPKTRPLCGNPSNTQLLTSPKKCADCKGRIL